MECSFSLKYFIVRTMHTSAYTENTVLSSAEVEDFVFIEFYVQTL
jgi:hypothetical protein